MTSALAPRRVVRTPPREAPSWRHARSIGTIEETGIFSPTVADWDQPGHRRAEAEQAGGRAPCGPWAPSLNHELGRIQLALGLLALEKRDASTARRRLEAAIKRLQSAANRFWEAAALIALGRALAELGDANGARATLRVALQVGTSMGRWRLLRGWLEACAVTAAAEGRRDQALRLAAAAPAIAGWPGVLPVVLPSLSEAWLAAMRSVVGSRADAVWSDGADLPTEEAIAEALGTQADEDHPEPAAHRLTRREQEVVRLVAQGHTNREIAQALVISPGTARVHVERILSKLHLHSRIQLVVWAVGQHLSQTG